MVSMSTTSSSRAVGASSGDVGCGVVAVMAFRMVPLCGVMKLVTDEQDRLAVGFDEKTNLSRGCGRAARLEREPSCQRLGRVDQS